MAASDAEPGGQDEDTEQTAARWPAMRPISNRAIVVAGVVVALVTTVLMLVLVHIALTPVVPTGPGGTPSANPAVLIDAVRTALTAAAGTGGAAALLLAFRRQRHTEHAALVTADDARQRRINELYTSAVDQLGHEKAPVRLGGLYGLERLAQNTREQRQTIVNVLCSYLRMPHARGGASGDEQATGAPDPQEEREVRLTAQRILVDHLRGDAGTSFWGALDLDLTGAELIEVDFSRCRIGSLRCGGAAFVGPSRFEGASITGNAGFREATFDGPAQFDTVTVSGEARFDGATFLGDAGFSLRATFEGDASFDGATFAGGARFLGARFGGGASFEHATFRGFAGFARTTFAPRARFAGATFGGVLNLNWVRFDGAVAFAQIAEQVRSAEATFAGSVELFETTALAAAEHVWPLGWTLSDPPDDVGYAQVVPYSRP